MITVDTKKNLDSFGLICQHLVNTVAGVIKKKIIELKTSTPFVDGWKVECYHEDDYMILFISDDYNRKEGYIESMKPEKVNSIKKRIENIENLNFQNLYVEFGNYFYDIDRFLYIGPSKIELETKELSNERWKLLILILAPWIHYILVPKLYEIEKSKIERLTPKQFNLSISSVTKTLWILECEETSKQGTAFALEGYGLVTCEHVIGTKTKAFRPNDYSKKYDINVINKNKVIDLAIIQIEGLENFEKLKISRKKEINQLDSIAVAGFPNYRYGDSGVINTGQISGFRMVSGIRRMLVSMPLIAGNSGSPIFDAESNVIGVAVTGADRMENAHQTEHHGIIPIEALELIK